MALKDLLVYVDQTERAPTRLRLAADLAARHAGRLTALYVRELSHTQVRARSAAELGLASGEAMARANRQIRESIEETANQLQAALERLGQERRIHVEWRCMDGLASEVVPQHARYADLCILGQDRVIDVNSLNYSFSEQMLFVTGRPVLFVPTGDSFKTLGRRIVVAWNSSRAAARALNDAMPLIERAEQTTVLIVNAADVPARRGAPPLEAMLEHLGRHGASADAVLIENVPVGSIAETVQEKARALGADLIVAGAFGHPQLWEKLLGGVTRDLLARMSVPILMSH
jgi:nucleotide-binding universal stress UspA family protein